MSSLQEGGDLDDYDLAQEIGKGRRSIVYKALCMRGRLCSRVFAIKVPYPRAGLPDEITYSRSFHLHQELHHPNILTLYSVIPQGIQVTEYCSLGDLTRVVGHDPLPETKALCITRGIGSALLYLHDRKMTHRMIQPTYILLDSSCTPKLSHFESAIQPHSECPLLHIFTEYTAPEIIQGKPGSFPADIWSLGCVVLYMLLGHPPNPRPAEDAVPKGYACTPKLRELISKMLCHQPADRLSPDDLVSSITSLLHLSTPAERIGASLDKNQNPELIAAPQTTGNDARARRISLEDIGHQRLKELLSNNPERGFQGRRPARRIVSDPLPTRKSKRTIVIPFWGESGLDGRDVEQHSAKLVAHPAPSAKPLESEARKEGLPVIDTSCLRPQYQKFGDVLVSILDDKQVLVEFRDGLKKDPEERAAMVINSRQNQIKIYENMVSQDSLRHISPMAQYTRENLPLEFRKYYQAASVAIHQMQKRTPKLVAYTIDGRFSLMTNGPPGDVEASFSLPQTLHTPGSRADGGGDSTLRVRYSQDEGLVEVRRYVGGADGKVWTKKCMTSISNPRKISQRELARLDDVETVRLERLIQFSEACRTAELDKVFCGVHAPVPLHTRPENDSPAIVSLASLIPRRPNKLDPNLPRRILTT
ncbi:hypothetical protein D9756_004741 [Leucocoprinus leucothites]|uniref:Non-specific serine/threonine protein kinase n=1 Tax=Leucocoprinus leucothites TaxID=201217 RepID=A0A8H5LKL0_9AGAR|nr:hypothetical protein D9756_004741 [Leucoagaricus leucothites]